MLVEIRDTVEMDSINMEKYVKELTNTMIEMTRATGKMFEQENLRMINMVPAINPGGLGGKGGPFFFRRRREPQRKVPARPPVVTTGA